MGRLIDADALFKAVTEGRYTTGNIFKDMELQQFINEQPTAYDVDTVISRVHNYFGCVIDEIGGDKIPPEILKYNKAICGIIRKGGVE